MKKKFSINTLIPIMSFLILFCVFLIATRGTLVTPQNISNIVSQAFPVIIGGTGVLFVTAMGSTDLSVGANAALSATLGAMAASHLGTWAIFPVAIGTGMLVGALNGLWNSRCKMPSFMMTLAILNKALNNRMVDPSMIFIDGTHIKASANKKKFQKEQVAKAAKVYEEQLRKEVSEEREKLGKKVNDDDDDENKGSSGGGTVEKTVSKTDPDCGMFVKGAHERQFAYEAHTACDKHGIVLGVEVTAGNVSDSVAWDAVYDQVTEKFSEVEFVTMDAGYKTPWIAKKVLEHSRIPILPYTRYKGKKDKFKPWDFTYDASTDSFTCPRGHELRHTTTSKEGKRTYRSSPKICNDCPCRTACGANESGQRMLTTHIWQEYLDLVEHLRKTERGKELYAMRKETIERVFADAKEKHAMRYTHHRGLARVSAWVRLKYAAMNLKKIAIWKWNASDFASYIMIFAPFNDKTPVLVF